MDNARDIRTGQIVDAEDLLDLDVVDKDAYECATCGIRLVPCSYEPTNKRRPYFSRKSLSHEPDCQNSDEELAKIEKNAQNHSVATPDGFPVPFINKLVITTPIPTVKATEPLLDAGNGARHTRNRSSDKTSDSHHGRTGNSLRPIVRIFLKYPNDREHLPLSIPDCSGKTYQQVFYRLWSLEKPITVYTTPTHLYYGALHWDEPTQNENYLEYKLKAGQYDKEAKRYKQQYRVRIDWSNWTQRQKNRLLNEIEEDRVTVNDDKTKTAWLFVVGTQSESDHALITVSNKDLVCCLVGDKMMPQKKQPPKKP